MELDGDGCGAGEGTRDGGSKVANTIIVIITIIRAAVALSGGANINLHPVRAITMKVSILSIKAVKGEGNCLSIG